MRIRFDGPPGPVAPRFVEAEDNDGNSIRAGRWKPDAEGSDWFLVLNVERRLRRIRNLFSEIRGDWNDPRNECDEGRKLVDQLSRALLGKDSANA